MKRMRVAAVLAGCLMLAACGVPRAALELARVEAGRAAPGSDAEVRAALAAEPARWQRLGELLRQRELGGIGSVDARFVEMVDRVAAAARRSAAIVEAGEDDPALDRALAEEFARLWGRAEEYLGK